MADASARHQEELIEALGKIKIFEGIHPEGLARVASICTEEEHKTNTIIFKEGDVGDKLYLILEGRVRISREVAGMGEEALTILSPGAAFGEMSLIDDVPRSADARVHDRCRLLVLTKDALQELLFLDKDLAYEILWNFVRSLSTRLRQTNDKMTFLSFTVKF